MKPPGQAVEKDKPEDKPPLPLRHHEVYAWALQLYIMLSSGIPILTALGSIAKSDIPRVAPASTLLAKKVLGGHTLSEAMASLKPAFNAFVVNLVVIGENSGLLSNVLERISQRASRRDKMERAVKGSLAYPFFLAAVCIGMALFMAFYMFPRLLPFLTKVGATLPWPTRVLVWTTSNLSSFLLIATILAVGLARLVSTSDSRFERFRDWLLYDSPVIGTLNSHRVYADCLSDLHLLMDAGCDLVACLKLVHTPWPRFNRQVQQCLAELREGAEFSEAVERSGMFPRGFAIQIKSGEESGQLPRIFKMLSDNLDESVTLRVSQLVSVLEPTIFLVMGFFTGFVVLATFLPLYSLASSSGL